MPLASGTWGVGDAAFLALYLGALALAAALAGLVRRTIRALAPVVRQDEAEDALTRAPVTAAFLRRGRRLAVDACLGGLRVARVLTFRPNPDHRRGRALAVRRDPPVDLGPLAATVHGAIARGVGSRRALVHDPQVRASCRDARRDLLATGLLAGPIRRGLQRLTALAAGGAVVALGVARHRAAGHPPVALDVLIALALTGTIAGAVIVPRRTTVAGRALRRLRESNKQFRFRHHRPSWQTYGPAGGALGVALFGPDTMWSIDPHAASDLGFRSPVSVPHSSTFGGGVSCGGIGGSTGPGAGGGCGGGGCGGGGCGGH